MTEKIDLVEWIAEVLMHRDWWIESREPLLVDCRTRAVQLIADAGFVQLNPDQALPPLAIGCHSTEAECRKVQDDMIADGWVKKVKQ